MKKVGSKEAFFQLKKRFPEVCLVHLYTLEGAVTDTDFNKLSEETKKYLKKIETFVSKQKVSFIYSIDEENYPNIKTMLKPRKRKRLKEFYFSTNASSMRVKQYQNNPNASIYFYHKGLIKYVGVMLKGKMEVLTDQETKNALWQRRDTMFYKKGVTDPDYYVLKFTALSGRYCCDLNTENFDIN